MKKKDLHFLMKQLLPVGEKIFLSDRVRFHSYTDLANGVKRSSTRGDIVMTAVAVSSFQSYTPGQRQQMLDFLRDFFLSKRSLILHDLPSCKTVEQLDVFSEQLRSQMQGEYSKVPFAQSHKVDSFNRTRNLIDLYIEHLVSMADELAHLRSQLVPLLFLPLTSQIFDSRIFSSDELKKASVSEKSTFGELVLRSDYQFLQQIAFEKAQEFGSSFYRIYFDLMWQGKGKNRRYQEPGFNLFEVS